LKREADIAVLQNFALNVYSAQINILESSDSMQATSALLNQLDIIFVFIFTVELAINLFCRWFRPFVENRWCLFDFFVVGTSLITLAPLGVPFNLLLLFRCCRVIRVVGRFRSVRSIFDILVGSIVPMASAFFMVFLLSSICEVPLLCAFQAFSTQ
jgi:hypothetical protein